MVEAVISNHWLHNKIFTKVSVKVVYIKLLHVLCKRRNTRLKQLNNSNCLKKLKSMLLKGIKIDWKELDQLHGFNLRKIFLLLYEIGL